MSALKGTPPMTVTVTRTGDGVVVEVEHADHQSFSRAVDPRATRSMREWMGRHGVRDAALTAADYAVRDPSPRRTVSVYTYTLGGSR